MPYLVLFLLLSIAWTWPLATRLSTRIAHDPGDPVLNAWILWWNTQALPFTDRWWSPPFFFPAPGALALSEHLAGIALFTAPLHFAGFNPAAVYNLALIATCWFSGFFAFLLGRRLTGSVFGGLVCGLAFGFAPYRASQLPHLQVLAAQWVPLALYAMHSYVADGRSRWLALFGAAWVLQALTNGYYLLFVPVLIGLWLLWRGTLRQRLALGVTFAASSLLLIPVLLRYQHVHSAYGLRRFRGEMLDFSARWQSFIQAADVLAFWPPLERPIPEGHLFPGVTVIGCVVAGVALMLWRRELSTTTVRRSPTVFYVIGALVFWWLSFGPARMDDLGAMAWRPYSFLMWLPGFEGLRVPARFAMLATLCIAAAASVCAVRLAAGKARFAVGAVVLVGIFADGWIEPMPLAPLPSRFRLPDLADAVVLELPLDDPAVGVAAMYRAITHRRPLVNGFSGHAPPHHEVMSVALRREDPSLLHFLAAGRPLVVLIHRQHHGAGEWRAYVERAGGQLHEESGLGPVFVIPPRPRARRPPLGGRLPVVPTGAGAGYVAVDLGHVETVRAVTIPMRGSFSEIAARLLVETSENGTEWTTAWEGWTGGPATAGAIENPTVAPLTLFLPDVSARYVRISPMAPSAGGVVQVFGPGK